MEYGCLCFAKSWQVFSFRALVIALFLTLVVPVLVSSNSGTNWIAAQAASCRALSGQLVSLNRQIAGGGQLKKRFSSAGERQRAQLRKAQAALNRLGCRKQRNLFKRSVHKNCSPLRKTIRRMKRNLARLGKTGARSGSNASIRRAKQRRSSVIRSMKRQGCGQYAKAPNRQKPKKQRTATRNAAAAQRPANKQAKRRSANNATNASLRVTKAPVRTRRQTQREQQLNIERSKTFRTMCVRTCDGFYFPVSYSTTQSSFINDAQNCAAMCPGAKTELYYYKRSEGSPETMISARRGTAYTKLPTAFRYKRAFDKSCSCNHSQLVEKNQSTRASKEPATGAKPPEFSEELRAVGASVLPLPRAQWGDDPDTMITRVGGFDLSQLDALLSGRLTPSVSLRKRRVRVVGDAFLPAQ